MFLVRAAALGLLLFLTATTLRAEEDADADSLSATVLEADEESCADPSDEACGLSLRQLRAAATEETLTTSEDKGEYQLLEESLMKKSGGSSSSASASQHHGGGSHNHIGGTNIKTLYHQTSPEAGASILKTGFRLGTWHAICGSAIYFSPSVHDTEVKAIGGRGYIIEAKVDLGKEKWMGKDCDWHMTGAKLAAMGYDSITLDRGGYKECWRTASCREYVIYDPRRVLSMKGWTHQGWKHWYAPMARVSNLTDDDASDAQSLAESSTSSTIERHGS